MTESSKKHCVRSSALAFAAFALGFLCLPLTVSAAPTVVHVKPGQMLNDAIADVEGAVCIILPEGITEHNAPLTRNATVIIKGQDESLSTLRPAAGLGPDEGVALIEQSEGHEGDLILTGFTYDRSFHPGSTPGNPDITTGARVLTIAAEGTVRLENVTMFHFDFGAREGESNDSLVFTTRRPGIGWRDMYPEPEDTWHQKDIIFRNVTIDFEKGGGIRHRPGARSRAFSFGHVDRIRFDANTVFRHQLCQDANPEYTVGPVWRNRGKAGTMYGMGAYVHEYAYIDGVWYNCDYGCWRGGGAATEDAVIEWRMDVINGGYGDLFWTSSIPEGQAGHLIYKDVMMTSAPSNSETLWHDRGFKSERDWKSITIDGCTIDGRGAPVHLEEAVNQGQVTIRNTTLITRSAGLIIQAEHGFDGIQIDGLNVWPHAEAPNNAFKNAVSIREGGAGGGLMTISDVRADGHLYDILNLTLGPDTTLKTSNIQGRREVPETLVEDAPVGATVPRRELKIDGNPEEAAELEPIATMDQFRGTDPFTKIELYLTESSEGVNLLAIVGDDRASNKRPITKLYRGDSIQFAITNGRPGASMSDVLFDLGLHEEKGPIAYRRSFGAGLKNGLVDIPLAITYDKEKQQLVYEAVLPWEEIAMPAPWYDSFSIDMTVCDDDAYGAHYKGAIWLPEGYDTCGIFSQGTPRSVNFKWVTCEGM